ncbi:SIR2 family protein [Silvibacterium acidisoli]|uniref:SIR2 family protein n=1 Tax=Acidobacteriaceae bacterium ZG23-2 TaxID=2883246 RepID=UPI00406CCC1F
MTKLPRIALLAGAGLSADAGLPMSVELARRLREKLLTRAATSEGTSVAMTEREQAERWLALFHFLEGGVRFQEGILNRNPGSPVNIEQIAIAAEELHHRTKNPLAAYAAGWHKRIEDLETRDSKLLSSFLDFTYRSVEEELRTPKDVSYLEGLKDLCIDGSGLDIFSLNYDLCVESALSAASEKFINGFDENGVWSPDSFSSASGINLFKLHGSLDWVDDPIYGLCSLAYPRHESADTMQGDDTRPHLVFGTAHKLSAKEPFLTLAYNFSRATLKAQILAVVGYSFADEHINQIIDQGMKKNSGLRLIVASPNAAEIVASHSSLDKNPRVSLIAEKAEGIFNKKLLRQEIRKILKDASTEAPFS